MSTSAVRLGGAGTSLTERPGSPKILKTPSGERVTVTYDVMIDSAEAALAAASLTFGESYGAPYTDSRLREIEIAKDPNSPTNAIVSVFYYPDPWTSRVPERIPAVGTITLEGDSNAIKIPIEQHADWSSTIRAKRVPGGALEGVTHYLSPQPVFRRGEILDAFTWTESNLIVDVGKRFSGAQMATKGLAAATTDAWLKMVLRIRQVGDKFDKGESWQFAENGWNTDIYATAVGS